MTTAETSLLGLIRQVSDESTSTDVRELAALVAERTPGGLLMEYYVEALAPLVRIVLGQQRLNAAEAVRQGVPIKPPRGGRTKSSRAKRVRDQWQEFLNSRLSIGDGVWKLVGEATIEDLRTVIANRVDHIAAVQEQVDHYERIVAAMEEQGVQRVDALSGEVQ